MPYVIRHPKLRYFGMSLLNAWSSWINLNGYGTSPDLLPISSNGATSLFLLVIIIVFLKKSDDKARPALDATAALALSLATIAFSVSNDTTIQLIGMLLTGAGMAWLYVSWGQFYSRIHLKNAIACIFVSYALSSAIKLVLLAVPDHAAPVLLTVFPLASAFYLRTCGQTKGMLNKERGENSHRSAGISHMRAFALCIAFYTAALALVRTLLLPEKTIPLMAVCHAGEIVLAIIVLAAVLLRKTPTRIISLWSILLFFVATALLLASADQLHASMLYADLGTSFLVMLSWAAFADLSRHSPLHPYVIFGIGRLSYSLPACLTYTLSSLPGFTPSANVLSAFLFWILSMVTAFFFGNRALSSMTFFGDLSSGSDGSPSVSDVASRCGEIAAERGLTERESEVMALLCLGKSKAYIAEELFLSESTVKTHTRNLYLKLEVHSRNELQKIIGL